MLTFVFNQLTTVYAQKNMEGFPQAILLEKKESFAWQIAANFVILQRKWESAVRLAPFESSSA